MKKTELTESQNPYQTPCAAAEPLQPDKRLSIFRGLVYSVLFAPIGFLIPTASYMTLWTVRYFGVIPNPSLKAMLTNNFDEILSASIGFSIAFSVAAFRNYTPAEQFGMLRSLLYVWGFLCLGGIVLSLVSFVFGLQHRSYGTEPWEWGRSMIVLLFPICYVCITIGMEMKMASENEI